uniref:GIY-YIG domain-containing protein n=1 Tax=viral metagenome TaxID=1070528 RepID=A0A6C0HYS3_9ZZZZ
MSIGYIYKIVFSNGKHYIGLTTTSLEQRSKEHKLCAKNGDEKCLYKALRKYDMVDTFELIEIDTADTVEELREKEIGYIIEYNSYYIDSNGYNMTRGGEGINGYVFTEEERKKNSERKKKYFENSEARKKQSETIKKYYENHEEAGKEHSERMKKYYENPEAITKNSEALKKYYQENPEAITKNSERRKKYFENPQARQQQSEQLKKYYKENPEALQKNREAQKNRSSEWIKKRNDTLGQNKLFDVFKTDGTFIKTFAYSFEAKEYLQKEYNITSTIKIGAVLSGRQNNSAGFVFKYK